MKNDGFEADEPCRQVKKTKSENSRKLSEEITPLSPETARQMISELQADQAQLETRNHELEHALEAERNILVTLIDTIPHRIFVKDKDCRFTLNNMAHIKSLGANSQAEVLGKTDHDLKPADLADSYLVDDRNVIEKDEPLYNYEEPTRLPSGESGTLLVSKAPLHNASGEVIGLVGISYDITDRKRMEQELRMYAEKLEEKVERRTQELYAANQELTAMNEELTAMNEEIIAMNESLEDANQNLEAEIEIRQQKEQEALLREKQYHATTSLLALPGEDFDGLLKSILQDATQLVGAPGGDISLLDESGKNFVFHHSVGIKQGANPLTQPVDRGMLGQVYRSGKMLCVEDYRCYPHRINEPRFDRLTTTLMVPLTLDGERKGVLAANWQDDVHPVTTEDIEVFRQFGILASIAMARASASTRISRQNQLLQKLAETTASLVTELDLDKALQNILDQATSFMGIPHGFVQLFEPDGRHTVLKCGLGRYKIQVGERLSFHDTGLVAEVMRTGKAVVVDDYVHWPQRLQEPFYADITAAMQAPLNIEGKMIGSIGLTAFGEPVAMHQEKLAAFEQFATVAAIAVKNALSHQETHRLAFHDTLTGLPNRAHLNLRLEEEMQQARRGESAGAVMFIDLDDLKTVNDHFGHTYGDSVIVAAGQDIAEAIGNRAFVARVGGDEFVVILPEADLKQIAQIADRLVDTIRKEYVVRGQSIHMSTSIGITLYPADATTAEEILKNADIAMYAAKAAGKSNWRFYEPEMLKDTYDQMVLTNSLRHALEAGELYLHYQPQIALADNRVVGFEALLRWNSRKHGRIMPGRFIPLAEQRGLIQPIGQWVIGEACRFARKLTDLGRKDLHVAVNVSPRQLATEDFVKIVSRCIDEAGIAPEQLEVEITENVLIDSLEDSTKKLIELNALGVRLSLDDFGIGFSSLTYLRNLPVGTLKIDKSFIDRMVDDKVQEGFIRSIVDMAHVLGLSVVAEGVETDSQLSILTRFGCDCVQGYVFSKPVSREDAIHFSI